MSINQLRNHHSFIWWNEKN